MRSGAWVRAWVYGVLACSLVSGVLTTTPAQAQDGSGQDSPIALGESGNIGDYEVTVVDVVPDATDLVMAENQFNEPPAPGNQFFLVRLSVTYTGSESGTPAIDLSFNAVGASRVGFTTYQNSCGVIPDSDYEVSELFEGGTAEFNECWQIPSSDATSLVMYIEELFNFDSEPVWFSLGLQPSLDATPESSLKRDASDTEVVSSSSRSAPIPVGSTGQVGSYLVTVIEVVPLADDVVAAENQFNEPPGPGNQFFLVTVSVTNEGDQTGTPWLDLDFRAVGESSVGYTQYDNDCGVIPNDSTSVGDLFEGGTVTFNVCWQITSADAESLVMYVEPLFAFDSDNRKWFALRDG